MDEAGAFFGVDDVAAESAGARGGEDPAPAFAVALAFVSAAACRASPASRACTASLVAWRADAISAAAAAALASARFLASIESTGSGVKEYFSASFSFFSFFSLLLWFLNRLAVVSYTEARDGMIRGGGEHDKTRREP